MPQISKSSLTLICGAMTIVSIGTGFVCQLVGRDSIALTVVGRNICLYWSALY